MKNLPALRRDRVISRLARALRQQIGRGRRSLVEVARAAEVEPRAVKEFEAGHRRVLAKLPPDLGGAVPKPMLPHQGKRERERRMRQLARHQGAKAAQPVATPASAPISNPTGRAQSCTAGRSGS